MVGADRDRNDAVLVCDGAHPGDGMANPRQAETPRAQHRFLLADRANLPPVAGSKAGKLGPEIAAGNAGRRGTRLDHENVALTSQCLGKVWGEGARYGHTPEPAVHLGYVGDRVNCSSRSILAIDGLGIGWRAEQVHHA